MTVNQWLASFFSFMPEENRALNCLINTLKEFIYSAFKLLNNAKALAFKLVCKDFTNDCLFHILFYSKGKYSVVILNDVLHRICSSIKQVKLGAMNIDGGYIHLVEGVRTKLAIQSS